MKGFAIVLFCLATTAFGESLGPSGGVTLGYVRESQYYALEGGANQNLDTKDARVGMHFLSLGGFADFHFLEASLGLLVQLGPQNSRISDSTSPDSSDIDSQYVDLVGRFLAKYPLTLGQATWFPLLGLEYSQNLTHRAKVSFLTDSELNDLYLDAGVGLDLPLNDRTYLRMEGIYALNLTPTSQTVKDMASQSGYLYQDYSSRFGFSLGLGSRF